MNQLLEIEVNGWIILFSARDYDLIKVYSIIKKGKVHPFCLHDSPLGINADRCKGYEFAKILSALLNEDESTPIIDERWRARLTFDPNVSSESPVIKGTWVTVDHVIGLIIDGLLWHEILRSHPEITEEDIKICLEYMIVEDNEKRNSSKNG